MIGTFIRLREKQYQFLKDLPGDMAEHIRNAVDDYIKKQNKESSISQSKVGESNG